MVRKRDVLQHVRAHRQPRCGGVHGVVVQLHRLQVPHRTCQVCPRSRTQLWKVETIGCHLFMEAEETTLRPTLTAFALLAARTFYECQRVSCSKAPTCEASDPYETPTGTCACLRATLSQINHDAVVFHKGFGDGLRPTAR